MKKILTVGLTCITILFVGTHLYIGNNSTSNEEKHYEVSFEDAKLIKSETDEDTGVKIDVYTIEGWEK